MGAVIVISDIKDQVYHSMSFVFDVNPSYRAMELSNLLTKLRDLDGPGAKTDVDIGIAIGRQMRIYVAKYEVANNEVEVEPGTHRCVGGFQLQCAYTDSVFYLLKMRIAPFDEWVQVSSRQGRVFAESGLDDEGLCWHFQDPDNARDLIDRWGRSLFRVADTGPVVVDLYARKL